MAKEDEEDPARKRKRTKREGGRGAEIGLAIAIIASSLLVLYETRHNTLYNDELVIFQQATAGWDLGSLLEPFNGHLIFTGSLIYQAVFEIFGPDRLVLQLLGIAAIAAMAVVLFAYLRRRVRDALALPATIVVLFMGSAWEVLLWPLPAINTGIVLAAGIGALMALERDDRRGDVVACLLLILALATFTYGLPFLLGAFVAVMLGGDRWHRAWVFIIPLTLFAAWWLWALQFDNEGTIMAVNVWLIPAFAAESLAVVLAALTGLSANLSGEGINATINIEPSWGRVLAVGALVGLALRIRKRGLPRAFWVTSAVLVAYWALIALSLAPDRTAEQSRFILPGAVLLLLVAANALKGIQIRRGIVIATSLVAAVAVMTGIRQLHDGEAFLKDYSARTQAVLAGLERAPDPNPEYVPRYDLEVADSVPDQLTVTAGPYLEAVKEFGSPAYSREELAELPPIFRALVEQIRVAAIADAAGVAPP